MHVCPFCGDYTAEVCSQLVWFGARMAHDADPWEERKKSLRSLTGLGGVSISTLAKQLDWIKEHPEVASTTSANARKKGRGDYTAHVQIMSSHARACLQIY